MKQTRLWLRWSWRDLRRRWLVVAAISTVIAVGTGLATGLGSMETWRIQSNDASFAAYHAHDLRVSLAEGSFASSGQLEAAVRSIPDAGTIVGVSERFSLSTQIELPSRSSNAFVTSTLVGVDLKEGGPEVDSLALRAGRALRSSDAGKPVTALQETFAKANDLPVSGTVSLPGGRRLRVVGFATAPEQFALVDPNGIYSVGGNYGVLYVPIETAQSLSGRPKAVNEVVVRLKSGSDRARIERELKRVFADSPQLAALGASITLKEDESAYRMLYEDAHGDQQIFDAFSFLVLVAAGFAAFTLIGRVVEAQRREIGIGMALGVERRRLAVRPLLMGTQIALLGALLGVGTGFLITNLMNDVYRESFTLPVMKTGLAVWVFARGAVLGFLIPLVATFIPVWRGVRLSPIEAIRTGPRATKGAGLSRLMRGITLPGSALAQMPIRNLLRTPRRTLATLLAVASVITIVIAFGGMLDSFYKTVDNERRDRLATSPRRIEASLDRFYSDRSRAVRAVERSPLVARSTTGISTAGELGAESDSIDIAINLIRFGNTVWQPRAVEGRLPAAANEILIARKAARDLGVGVNDRITIRYPQRVGASAFRTVEREVIVSGLHASPLRGVVYLDYAATTPALGLIGVVNTVTVDPRPSVSDERIERTLFSSRAVSAVRPISGEIDDIERNIDQFIGIIRIAEIGALILTLLIAFNAVSINAEERRRDYATLFAFGFPVRSVMRVGMIENAVVGTVGTLLGVGLGALVLRWIVDSLMPETMPDLEIVASISIESLAIAALVGVAAMIVAPLLVLRRLRNMDVPSTLRVVE